MPRSPLYDKLAAAGAHMGDHAGADTAASFGGAAAEFSALREGCGLCDLGWRAKLLLTGQDRAKWLNGMVTNNVRDLPENHGVYSFLLDAQGHILGDMYLYNRGDYILLDTDAAQSTPIREVLEKFIIMDDVEVADASAKLSAVGLIGPQARAVLRAAGADPGELQPLEVRDLTLGNAGISVVARDTGGYELWAGTAFMAEVWDALRRAGATPVGAEALELWRIARGVPRYGHDIRERVLPQETEQERALNFSKGCYVGQEIVERIRSRGAVHRKFTGFVLTGPPPAPGAKLQKDGKDVGEFTSVATIPAEGGRVTVGLGYVRREVAEPGAVLQYDGGNAAVANLPFDTFQLARPMRG